MPPLIALTGLLISCLSGLPLQNRKIKAMAEKEVCRIIYFQQNLTVGACEEYFYLLIQGMGKRRFEVIFACPQTSILDPLVTKIQALGIKVYRYSLAGGNYRLILRLLRLFQKIKPEIIHFNDPSLNGIIAARLAGVPVLVTTHHTPELDRRYSLKGKILEKIVFRHSRLFVIFNSEYDQETGIKKDGILRKRSFVVYYGLPPEKFASRYDRKNIYGEFNLAADCRIIANIARLSWQKGQARLIEAAPSVVEKFKNVKFFFVGEGELAQELKARVKERRLEDYFVFTGHRNDIPRLLSAFEIMVMPSLFEGLSFAVIEAAAMGVPVIATAVGGMRRSVVNGKTGILVPPADPAALARAIIWMLEHPQEAKEMGQQGKKYFQDLFTQEQMVKRTEEIYEKLYLEKR